MNPMEQQVWAAAFAQAWHAEYKFRRENPRDHLPVDGISGFSCGELADLAVETYREALTCEDREYLLPVKEKWK